MTETRFLDVNSASCSSKATGHSLRKRKASSAAFSEPEFIAFLKETGFLNSVEDDPTIAELFKSSQDQLLAPEAMNDLPGAFAILKQDTAVEPALSGNFTRETLASQLSGPSCLPIQHQGSVFAQQQQSPASAFHRAVITQMPISVPALKAAVVADEDDTNSAATLPMPNKRRRTDDDEVTSSPNDLVEVPSTTVVTTASGTAATAAATTATSRQDARASDTATAQDQQQQPAGTSCKAATAADAAVVKAILVAKVLTKSDSNSKRIILPRIAVEANLPQLSHAQVFNFSATDPSGASWPLVIKAWANGQNPKPVYVLEQVGELLKQYKLVTGDAFALLASEDGRFFLEWNTDAARAAAARPTYSAFTFKQQRPAAPATPKGSGKSLATAAKPPAAAAAVEQTGQQQEEAQQQHEQQQPLAVQQPPVAVKAEPQPAVQQPSPQQWQQQQLPVIKQQQQRHGPLMTAIPVTSTPMVSGISFPTSPCQLLVLNSDNPFAGHSQYADPLLPTLSRDLMMIKTRSDAAFELPEPASLASMTPVVNAVEGEALLVPVAAESGENGALHAGGFLLCPRTPGCTRPAGHQGWCLGHKGYKKRRV